MKFRPMFNDDKKTSLAITYYANGGAITQNNLAAKNNCAQSTIQRAIVDGSYIIYGRIQEELGIGKNRLPSWDDCQDTVKRLFPEMNLWAFMRIKERIETHTRF